MWSSFVETAAPSGWVTYKETSPEHSHSVQEVHVAENSAVLVDGAIKFDGSTGLVEAECFREYLRSVDESPSSVEFIPGSNGLVLNPGLDGLNVSVDYVDYTPVKHGHVISERISVVGLVGTLANTPMVGSERIYDNDRSAPTLYTRTDTPSGEGDYSIDGNVVTFFLEPPSHVYVDYLIDQPYGVHEHVMWEFLGESTGNGGEQFQTRFKPRKDSDKIVTIFGSAFILTRDIQYDITDTGFITMTTSLGAFEDIYIFYIKDE